jgi:urease accessory protein
MLLVGLLAAQIGGRAIWALPLAFVAMMVVGGVLGMTGVAMPFVEVVIALSVLVLGGVLALGWTPPVALAIAAAGIFAVFHGHSHGTEMPYGLSVLGYGSGFVVATLVLQATGLLLGFDLRQIKGGALALRFAGGSAAAVGVLMLIGVA